MSFANDEIDLKKYQCAQCNRNPENPIELFRGCTCGHRLFRIISNNKQQFSPNKNDKMSNCMNKEDFLTIRERSIGIYDINVDNLLKRKSKEEKSPVVAGNNGVYSIRLDSSKKK